MRTPSLSLTPIRRLLGPKLVLRAALLILALLMLASCGDSDSESEPSASAGEASETESTESQVDAESVEDESDGSAGGDGTTTTTTTTMAEPPDDDRDGWSNEEEGDGSIDSDGDGIPDSADSDSDNDGVLDRNEYSVAEARNPECELAPSEYPDGDDCADDDRDNVRNHRDECKGERAQIDVDQDGCEDPTTEPGGGALEICSSEEGVPGEGGAVFTMFRAANGDAIAAACPTITPDELQANRLALLEWLTDVGGWMVTVDGVVTFGLPAELRERPNFGLPTNIASPEAQTDLLPREVPSVGDSSRVPFELLTDPASGLEQVLGASPTPQDLAVAIRTAPTEELSGAVDLLLTNEVEIDDEQLVVLLHVLDHSVADRIRYHGFADGTALEEVLDEAPVTRISPVVTEQLRNVNVQLFRTVLGDQGLGDQGLGDTDVDQER